jgi:transcriptional regulator with XRE-family HTH domain
MREKEASRQRMSEVFAQWLRDQLERRPEMNQSSLSHLLGVRRATVSGWVRGEYIPRDHHLEQIAELFGVTKTDLYVLLGRVAPPGPLEDVSPEIIAIAQRIGELPEEQREKVMRALIAVLDLIVE